MPRGNYWYSNLEANDPKMKEDLSKYMKMYRLIKADIRQLTAELAGNTAQPDASRECYRALHRIFNGKSITRSKEAARLMLALGDPDLLRALKRRYPKQHCSGSIDVQRRDEKLDAKKVHGKPVGRMEIAGDVIHTVFSETEVDQDGSNTAHNDRSVLKRKDLVKNDHRQMIVNYESTGNTRKQSSKSGPNLGETILLQESRFLINEDRKACRNSTVQNVNRTDGANIRATDLSNSWNSKVFTSSAIRTGIPPLKKDCIGLAKEMQRTFSRNHHVDLSAQSVVKTPNDPFLNVFEKTGNVQPLGRLSRLCASPIPKDSTLDQNALTWNNKPYPRPSSGPAILVSDDSPDQKKRVLHLASLHLRPGAIHLPDGRISVPASLPKMAPTTVITRVNSLQELSQMSSSSVSQMRKNIGMASIGIMGSVSQPDDYELSDDILEDLYVVKQHRRSFFADGNSLVEVRPRSMPTAPTLIAIHTSEGKFNVPADIESNRRAILGINAMKKSLRAH